MSSYYTDPLEAAWVRESESYDDAAWADDEYGSPNEDAKTVRCNVCKGSGLVIVHGQETDCLNCEGYGDVEIR